MPLARFKLATLVPCRFAICHKLSPRPTRYRFAGTACDDRLFPCRTFFARTTRDRDDREDRDARIDFDDRATRARAVVRPRELRACITVPRRAEPLLTTARRT